MGKKAKKDELCSKRSQTTVFGSRLAGKPFFGDTFNDQALQAAVIRHCPLVTGQHPPAPRAEPLRYFTRPEDSVRTGVRCRNPHAKTSGRSSGRSSRCRRASAAGRKGANSVPGVLGIKTHRGGANASARDRPQRVPLRRASLGWWGGEGSKVTSCHLKRSFLVSQGNKLRRATLAVSATRDPQDFAVIICFESRFPPAEDR